MIGHPDSDETLYNSADPYHADRPSPPVPSLSRTSELFAQLDKAQEETLALHKTLHNRVALLLVPTPESDEGTSQGINEEEGASPALTELEHLLTRVLIRQATINKRLNTLIKAIRA